MTEPDDRNVLAHRFTAAMSYGFDVALGQKYGPDIVGKPLRREKAAEVEGAKISFTVRRADGTERTIHLAEVTYVRRAEGER